MFTNISGDTFGIKQKAINLFITFFFVFFFFQFFRKIMINKPTDNKTITKEIILFMLWYSISLTFS